MIFLYLYRNPKFPKKLVDEKFENFVLLSLQLLCVYRFHTVLQVFIYRALKFSNIYNKTTSIGFSAFRRRRHHSTQQWEDSAWASSATSLFKIKRTLERNPWCKIKHEEHKQHEVFVQTPSVERKLFPLYVFSFHDNWSCIHKINNKHNKCSNY